ncbi:hypothetical protein QO259_16360 [Salinicola sp. JS01]|uniref:hypothetical protein n=1 Tax=Salinicola sp. JS01 TaxID=3050071 RepID=UPI00255B4AB0|nr:hypothetical protein [Salinicola sp. JS01]WIX32362.1 hypothetical protein QO259_16360 [Salinicola sp. JS01]
MKDIAAGNENFSYISTKERNKKGLKTTGAPAPAISPFSLLSFRFSVLSISVLAVSVTACPFNGQLSSTPAA